MNEQEEILLATSIAMELSKNLTNDEICDLIAFVNQISCSLSGLLNMKNRKRTNFKN